MAPPLEARQRVAALLFLRPFLCLSPDFPHEQVPVSPLSEISPLLDCALLHHVHVVLSRISLICLFTCEENCVNYNTYAENAKLRDGTISYC